MTQDIDRLFNHTKGNLFFMKGSGFLGSLLCKVRFSWDTSIATAGINPDDLIWNPDFFLSLDKETRVTVLAHELWHNGYLHSVRRGDRNPELWNIAADHRINNDLKKGGYYMDGFPYLMEPKYADDKWSTDLIYEDLLANPPPNKPNALGGDILDFDTSIPASVQVAQAITDVISAVTTARITNTAGDIPGEITTTLDKFLNPKLPWETLLFNFFNALTSEEYSYQRPNRRYDDPYLPGRTGRNGLEHLVYAVDVSGSITDDQVLRMNSEVKFIQEELNPEKLTLLTFDTLVRDTYVFEKDDPFDKIEINGRGGTALEGVYEFVKKDPTSALIIFTDLWVDIPPDPKIPIIWVCVDNPTAEVPYGTLIHFSEDRGVSYGITASPR